MLAGRCDRDVALPFGPFESALDGSCAMGWVRMSALSWATLPAISCDSFHNSPTWCRVFLRLVREPEIERFRLFQAVGRGSQSAGRRIRGCL